MSLLNVIYTDIFLTIMFYSSYPKDDSDQLWFKLTQWFQRRLFLKITTDGRRTPSEGNR